MAKGKVAQVIGTVVDVEFPPDELPALYDAIEILTNVNAANQPQRARINCILP